MKIEDVDHTQYRISFDIQAKFSRADNWSRDNTPDKKIKESISRILEKSIIDAYITNIELEELD